MELLVVLARATVTVMVVGAARVTVWAIVEVTWMVVLAAALEVALLLQVLEAGRALMGSARATLTMSVMVVMAMPSMVGEPVGLGLLGVPVIIAADEKKKAAVVPLAKIAMLKAATARMIV